MTHRRSKPPESQAVVIVSLHGHVVVKREVIGQIIIIEAEGPAGHQVCQWLPHELEAPILVIGMGQSVSKIGGQISSFPWPDRVVGFYQDLRMSLMYLLDKPINRSDMAIRSGRDRMSV